MLEHLEDRRLLATSFTGPSLSGLISEAFNGKNTSKATIKTMLSALQSQLTSGPLADLNSGAVDGDGFITEVQSLVTSYNQNVDQQLLPHFTHIDNMLKLQGQQVVANLVSLNQQSDVGLTSSTNLPTVAGATINTLTSGPIYSLNTPVSAYVTTTQTFETDLGVVTDALSSTAPTPLALSDVNTTIQAESEAYRASMDAGLQVTHTGLSTRVNEAVTSLESTVNTIANENDTTAEVDIHTAIATFDSTILDTTGLFGLNGPVIQVNSKLGYLPHDLVSKQAATSLSVSGTAAFGGTATLTATLTSANGTGLSGKVVNFTLDGAFAGTAVTDSNGDATLTGVATSDAVGTDSGGVVASFAGNSTNLLSSNSGDLVVSQSATSLGSVSGTASFGGTATLTATLTSSATSSPISGETVDFTLDGTSVGSAVTDSSGVATLSNVATTDPVGTHTGVVVASYAGSANFAAAANATGDLVVSQAATTLASISGTATFGGTASLTATLTSSVTNQPIPGATLEFSLDGGSAMPATTNASGVATLTGVATSDPAGTKTGAVTVSYGGTTNFASATGTGNLVVSLADTALTSVSNSPTVTGNTSTTLSATLTNTSANVPVASGQTVTFTITHNGGSPLVTGTGMTNGSGVATALVTITGTGVAVGDTITASYAGSPNYNPAINATGTVS